MLTELGKKAKAASRVIGVADTETKNRALITIADSLEANAERILNANALDMENGRKNGMSRALLDRLSLTKERISGFAGGMRDVTKLPDPVGRTLDDFTRPNGLHI